MIVRTEIPELTVYPDGFPRYWFNLTFTNNRADDYRVNAIVTTYVRLVEAAHTQYREARRLIMGVWDRSLGLYEINHAATQIENCITSMHRAILCMERIRGNANVPVEIKALIPERPGFSTNIVANRLKIIRNTIQHLDDKVLKGIVPQGTPFTFNATGPETAVPDSDQPGQTLKIIDRLVIGKYELPFSDLFNWLVEMGECAEKISRYNVPEERVEGV